MCVHACVHMCVCHQCQMHSLPVCVTAVMCVITITVSCVITAMYIITTFCVMTVICVTTIRYTYLNHISLLHYKKPTNQYHSHQENTTRVISTIFVILLHNPPNCYQNPCVTDPTTQSPYLCLELSHPQDAVDCVGQVLALGCPSPPRTCPLHEVVSRLFYVDT